MLAEPIARSFDLDDDGVVEQAVEQSRGDDRIAEHLAPFGKAPVRGEDHRAFLVAGVDQLEEQIAAAGHDRQVADLVDDKQRGAAEEADALAQTCLRVRPWQAGDDVGERGEVDALVRPSRPRRRAPSPDGSCRCRAARADGPLRRGR